LRDADVPGFWQGLGLPGLIDVHTHFMPDRLMAAVWRYFDGAAEKYGKTWPIHYRVPVAERVAVLEALGVRTFTALAYPHKPGMAEGLCQWLREFAAATPGCVASGTFYPEPSAATYVRDAIEAGTVVFKAHLQVGAYDPRDELLTPVWGMLAEAGTPVVVHCGSGPTPGAFTGPGPFGEVLARHPRLTAIIAHAGAPEYEAHFRLARTFQNVHIDTTMVGTPFMADFAPLRPDVIGQLGDLQDKVVLGTDFPNIPYPYATQLDALQRFGLGEDWLRDVCWYNGKRLLART
jgi:predicted TIM-barrel fold metal-dependent hydrolase